MTPRPSYVVIRQSRFKASNPSIKNRSPSRISISVAPLLLSCPVFGAVSSELFGTMSGLSRILDNLFLEGLPALGSLQLSSTEITDRGVDHLIKLQVCGESFIDGTRITDLGVASLRKAKPGSVVSR